MAETLIADGDRDDYVSGGAFEAEVYANSKLDLTDVSGARRHDPEGIRRYSVMPAAGYLAIHKAMPTINDF